MNEGLWVALLSIAAVIAIALVETAAYWNVGGWLDVRSSQTADEVRRNIEEYGPEVPGLKLHLLPEDERAAVLEARRARAAERDARKAHRHAH